MISNTYPPASLQSLGGFLSVERGHPARLIYLDTVSLNATQCPCGQRSMVHVGMEIIIGGKESPWGKDGMTKAANTHQSSASHASGGSTMLELTRSSTDCSSEMSRWLIDDAK